jgi:hypothetical protein
VTDAAAISYRLSRIYAEGWNCARTDSRKADVTSNPYRSEPEQTRWNAGYAESTGLKNGHDA